MSTSPLYLAILSPFLTLSVRYRPIPAPGICDGATLTRFGRVLGARRFFVLEWGGTGVVASEIRFAALTSAASLSICLLVWAVALRVR